MESVKKKKYDIVNDFKLNSVIKKKKIDQTSLRWAARTTTFNDKFNVAACIGCNTILAIE